MEKNMIKNLSIQSFLRTLQVTALGILLVNCGNKPKSDDADVNSDQYKVSVEDGENPGEEKVKPEQKPEEKKPKVEKPTVQQKTEDEDVFVRLAEVDMGVKNFLQINATFSSLTGVSGTDNAVNATYNEVKDQLPSGNSIKTFSSSTQVGVTKLAATYCNVLMSNNTLRTAKIPNFNFGVNVNVAYNGEGEEAMLEGLIGAFWSGVTTQEEKVSGKAALKTLLGELKVGIENGNAVQTRNIAVGLCTAALSSSHVIFM